ncbi:MAG TPA: hypothetical protein VHE83_19405 [Mycobacteriales bacterium]|nr:hypothetical protein [Mycobacteriales bacterium]
MGQQRSGRRRRGPKVVEATIGAAVGTAERSATKLIEHVTGESRFPVTIAVLVAMACQLILPKQIVLVRERWLLPSLQGAVLVALIIGNPLRLTRESKLLRSLSIVLLLAIAFNDFVGIARLVDLLINKNPTLHLQGRDLIRAAAVIWITNVLTFAIAYFELDQGGPFARLRGENRADFQFPQHTDDLRPQWSEWRPTFVDYLFLSFTNCTAFSPTDTMPLTPRAKMLMLVQSLASFVTIGVVAARAVNILGS